MWLGSLYYRLGMDVFILLSGCRLINCHPKYGEENRARYVTYLQIPHMAIDPDPDCDPDILLSQPVVISFEVCSSTTTHLKNVTLAQGRGVLLEPDSRQQNSSKVWIINRTKFDTSPKWRRRTLPR